MQTSSLPRLAEVAETPTVMVSMVVPMFQEVDRISELLDQLRRWNPPFGATEVVFVDDGSTDGTSGVVAEALDGIDLPTQLVVLEENCGKGAAVRAGAEAATGRMIVVVDADAAISTTDIDQAVSVLLNGGPSLVIGNRRHEQSSIVHAQPSMRRWASRGFNVLVRTLGLTSVADTQCGLKAWFSEDNELLLRDLPDGFAWDVAVLHRAEEEGLDVAEVPVRWEHIGDSTVLPVRHGTRMAVDAIRLRRNSRLPRWSRAGMALLVLLFVGFGFRLAVASVTDNADARTLAWGSAFVASGSTDPYRDMIEFSESDPIPLGGIRSLSLAQGPIGVVAGSIPLFIGDFIGVIDLGDVPDGQSLGTGELFTYKLSYLVPELLVLVAIARLVVDRRRRLLAYTIWALSPLSVFAWGQGMPDTWTIAVILWSTVWLHRGIQSRGSPAAIRAYSWAAAIAALGAFGTKLLPLIMLVPIAVVVARDPWLDRARRRIVLVVSAAALLVGAVPYLVSPYVRANMLTRFEFNMLFDTGGVEVASALQAAHLPLVLLLAATVWMMARPIERVDPWIVTALLVIATMSGVITHLMIWALAAILLVVRRSPLAAVALAIATGIAATWHLLTYDWLAGLVLNSWDRTYPAAVVWPWVVEHVPAPSVLGAVVSSAVLATALAAVVAYLRDDKGRFSLRASAMSLAFVALLCATTMLTVPVIVGANGEEVWNFAQASFPSDAHLEVPRGGAWVGEEMKGEGDIDHLTFSIDESSQPSLDEVVFTARDRAGATLATATAATWQAEPKSEAGPVRVDFDKQFPLDGAHLVIERRPGPGEAWDQTIGPDGTVRPQNAPITNLEAMVTAEGEIRPVLGLFDTYTDESLHGLRHSLTHPGRLLGVAMASAAMAIFAWFILTRDETLTPRRKVCP